MTWLLLFQVGCYIGEMCRYILVTPPSPADHQHRVRTLTGIGMRPPVWVKFLERFRISKVVELYGATEGNVNMGEYITQKVMDIIYLKVIRFLVTFQ